MELVSITSRSRKAIAQKQLEQIGIVEFQRFRDEGRA